jgi:hypothetical protein
VVVVAVRFATGAELIAVAGGEDDRGVVALEAASAVLGEIRKRKSEEKRPLKTAARLVRVTDAPDRATLVEETRADLVAAGLIERLEIATGEFAVDVELAPAEALSRESGQ